MENKKRKQRKWLWGVMLWSLFWTGCGQNRLEMEMDSAMEGDLGEEVYSDSIYESEMAIQQETDLKEEIGELTGEAMLQELLECKKFAICVLDQIGIEEEDTKETILQKMEQCEFLTLTDPHNTERGFSLEDLRFFPNLKTLQIGFGRFDCSIEDFTPIAGLSQLKEFFLSYNGRELDLSFLEEMESITTLYFFNCQMADFTFLEKMPQLERLLLDHISVGDLPNLCVWEKLSQLAELEMKDCGIEEIGFLSSLTELRVVDLDGNAITDLTPLAGLSKLERLKAANNQICDIHSLAYLSNLFDLDLSGNQIQDISALAGLSHLNQVRLFDNQIEDFSPLEGKKELMEVRILENPCKDFRAVWTVPFFSYGRNFGISEKQQAVVDNWMAEYRPDIEEYECIDYTEGDLNQDGLLDAAFVVNGQFYEGDGYKTFDNDRRLFIILQQEDGLWKESEERLSVRDQFAEGMRGDPHHGLFMGDGYLIQETGWGSRIGVWDMCVYEYQDGKLKKVFWKQISNDQFGSESDVRIGMEKDGESIVDNYKIETRDDRLVRVDE